jgi:protein O-mannosyl-transferase
VKRKKNQPRDHPAAATKLASKTSPGHGGTAEEEPGGWLRREGERGWLFAVLLVSAVVVAYHPAWNAGFIWDDDIYVTGNRLLSEPGGLWRLWFSLNAPSQYFPLTYTVFWLERALWGFNPAGYHWVNILLHAVNAVLVWRLLRRLALPGAWLAAALFALHPVQVESVAWVTELKNILSLLFCLLAMFAWVEFVEERSRPSWRWFVLALATYALALLSKSTACTLPATLLLVLWLKRTPLNRVSVVQVLPFLALGLGMGVLAMWWERYHQGTHGQIFALGPVERLLVASRAIWFYAGKLAWPTNLAFSYPRWTINATDPLAYAWLAACVGFAGILGFYRRAVGRGVVTAVLFFAASLSPMLGFIMLYTFRYAFVADHYQYVASIGPAALTAAGLSRWLGTVSGPQRFVGPVLCATLLCTLAVLTWRQSATYTNLETLWRATLSVNPGSPLAHNNLGNTLIEDGKADEAITHFQIALKNRADLAETHNNLGNALLRKGELDAALAQFQQALELAPGLAGTHNNLGALLLEKDQLDEGIAHYRRAVQIDPSFEEAHKNLGLVLLQHGRAEEAAVELDRALELRPELATAHNGLGLIQLQRGQVEAALAHFQRAAELRPDLATAQNNLGIALLQKGEVDDARVHFERALQLLPDFPEAANNLGKALLRKGRREEAIACFRKALALRPDLAEARNNLAKLLPGQGMDTTSHPPAPAQLEIPKTPER